MTAFRTMVIVRLFLLSVMLMVVTVCIGSSGLYAMFTCAGVICRQLISEHHSASVNSVSKEHGY